MGRFLAFLVLAALAHAASTSETIVRFFQLVQVGSPAACLEAEHLLADDFEYDFLLGQMNKSVAVSNCLAAKGGAFLLEGTGSWDYGDFATVRFVGADLFPNRLPNASTPCTVFTAGYASGTRNANGLLNRIWESFNVTQYMTYYDVCNPQTPNKLWRFVHDSARVPAQQAIDSSDPAQFAQSYLTAVWLNKAETMVRDAAPDFFWRDGYAGMSQNLSALLAQTNFGVHAQPESIVTLNWIVDHDESGNRIVTLSGPSMVLVIDPKTTKPCLISFGQNARLTLTSSVPYRVKSLLFSYDSINIAAVMAKCHLSMGRDRGRWIGAIP